MCEEKPCCNASNIKEQILEVATIFFFTAHINRLIKDKLKLPSRIAAQKTLLALRMKKRLAFTKQYRYFTEEDRSTVMYSDPSTFWCIRSIRSRVRRPTRRT